MESRLLVSLNLPATVESPVTEAGNGQTADAVQNPVKYITKPSRQSRMTDEEVQTITGLTDTDMECLKVSTCQPASLAH